MEPTSRKKIALVFNFRSIWTGGIIYLVNISRILKFLKPEDQPELLIFYPLHLQKYVDEIDYIFSKKIVWDFPSEHMGFLKSIVTNRNLFIDKVVKEYQPDVIFPLLHYPIKSNINPAEVGWCADLQYKYYPNFFTKIKRVELDLRLKFTLNNAKHVIVSSHTVKEDFYKFFEVPKQINFHVYHFVSIIEGLPEIKIEDLLAKYSLPSHFFMISNQFHRHKNHKVVFKALAELKKQGKKIHIVITGSFPKDPNSLYLKELHALLNENKLHDVISFLGLIPRGDQLLLMKYAQAVIQPSLFEGWSTVIEDARSLQVPVIAADLKVNVEQLLEKGIYFSPHDVNGLAKILEGFPFRDYSVSLYEPYESRMQEAAYSLLSIFESSVK